MIAELHITVGNRRTSGKRGRPKKDEILEKWHKMSCTISLNPEVVCKEQELMGRFILASNDTTIDPDTCLQYYKEQSVEFKVICKILNYSDELRNIVRLMGPSIEKYYGLIN